MRVMERPDAADGARRALAFAEAALAAVRGLPLPHSGLPAAVRIGMHTGPALSGLVPNREGSGPRFSVVCDIVDMARAMEVGSVQARFAPSVTGQ